MQLGPFKVGDMQVQFLPHSVKHVGARLFIILELPGGLHQVENITPDEARRLADYLKAAACEAELAERKQTRKHAA